MAFTVEEIDAESIFIESVLVMHRKYSKTLGFLTRQAFIEQAAKGFLLGAMDGDGTLAGYALYYLPRREIKLTHLCVATGHRGQGIARMLINALCTRHPERTGIRLNCRRDFPANDIWPRLDFSPLSDAPGRSQAGHLLTTWFRDFGHPTLFSQATSEVEPIVVAALDTDVFLDLDPDESRPQSRESKGLLADWIADQATFVVTKEVSHELNNHPDAATRRKQLFRYQAFRQAGESTESWEHSRSKLDSIRNDAVKGNHDRSDRDHVARAHAAGLQYFITRDDGLRNKLGESGRGLGIRITSPGEFITDLWSSQDDTYAPAQLQNTDFGFESLAGVDLNALAPLFLMNGAVEKKKQLTKRIRDLASDATHVDSKVVKTGNGSPVALMVRVMNKDSLDVPVLRLSGTHQSTLGRHVAHLQSTFARDAGRWVTRVSDPYVSPHTARALAEEGYQEAEGCWWSVSIPLSESKNKLAAILESIEGVPEGVGLKRAVSLLRKKVIPATVAAELEQRFWPMKIKGSTLPTYLVPIRPWYAMELFDSALSSSTLFRQMPLGIYREQVYYRSPRPSCGLAAPARLLWYVSKQPEVAGSGSIRACSYLLEVTVDRPQTLYRRNAQLGVYELDDVKRVGSSGKAMALRFGMTETFRTPVPLAIARDLAEQNGCSNLPLQSPWRMPGNMFDDIYERGTHGSG